MTRFAKKETCPSSHTLSDYSSDALPPLARRAAAAHLRACDFCAAELRLLARDAATQVAADAPAVTPLPLALRLFGEARLAEANAAASSVKIAA